VPWAIAAVLGVFVAGLAPAAPPEGHTDREDFPLPAEAVARVGSARLRHGAYLKDLAYSPDGTRLLSVGGEKL
jgi:hypothetical protein